MDSEKKHTSIEVIEKLIQGNLRFVHGLRSIQTLIMGRNNLAELAKGQHPYCILVTCSDSRIPVELVFDHGLGELFVIRSFGNVVDSAMLGSIEYGAHHFNVPLCVVLGHTGCGAIRNAMEADEGSGRQDVPKPTRGIRCLTSLIRPAVHEAKKVCGPRADWEALFNFSTTENIRRSVEQIRTLNPTLKKLVESGSLTMVGALYELSSGQVSFDLPESLRECLDTKITLTRTQSSLARAVKWD